MLSASPEVLVEPLIQEHPLFRSRPVVLMKVGADSPVPVFQQGHRLVDPVEGRMKIVGGAEEEHRTLHERPVGAGIDGAPVEFGVLEVRAETASLDASREIHVLEAGAAHEGDHRLEPGIDRGQRRDHSAHRVAGETDSFRIHFRLPFEEGDRPPCGDG